MQTKIGIGCSTYNRPEVLSLWKEHISKYTLCNPSLITIYIADDSQERKGIAFRKNECLKALQDCDYIFLFDDDCFPIKAGWMNFFIDIHRQTNQHHFLYLKQSSTIKKTGQNLSTNIYDNCGGCFMFLTKEVLQKVGGFCKDYGVYGYEHAGYSERIYKAGLNSMGKYLCPEGAGEYIYSMDYDHHLDYHKKINFKPSMIKEIENIPLYLQSNMQFFHRDIQTIYQPL